MAIKTSFLFSILLLISCTSTQKKEPIIGVWVTNIDSEVMFSKEAIEEGVKKLHNYGFNTLYPVVWNDGYTLHPSEVMATYFGEEFRQDTLFKKKSLDPLQVMIEEARKYDMTVIPWFEFGFSSSYNQEGGHILAAKPEWSGIDADGNMLRKNGFEWMNAINPEVQDFLTALIMEVVKKYDIDGIQGDDRLPAMPSEGGYSSFTRALYTSETGNEVPSDSREETFLNWKSDKLTEYGKDLYDAVKAHDESLIVSYAPSIYPWSKEEYLQDWPAWIEAGAMDQLVPQAYRWDIDRYKETIDIMIENYQSSPGFEKVEIAPGIIIKAGNRFNDFSYVKEAVEHNRKRGLEGEIYFFYEGLFEQNNNLADSLFKYYYNPDLKKSKP